MGQCQAEDLSLGLVRVSALSHVESALSAEFLLLAKKLAPMTQSRPAQRLHYDEATAMVLLWN